MGAIASLSDLVNRMTGGNSGSPENLFFHKGWSVAGTADTWIAGTLYSAWRYDGYPAGGATPTTVEAPTKTMAGAIPFTNPGGGREKWITQAAAISSGLTDMGSILLYDRLLHIGGLSGTNAGAQTVGGSITRNTGGVGNMVFAEIYATIGTTPRTITANYTDNDGNTNQTSGAAVIGGSGVSTNDANVMIPIPLAAGDRGVQAVASVTLSASTGTAGDFGITVARPLLWIIPHARPGAGRDFTVGPGGMPEIEVDACLAYMFVAASTGECATYGCLSTVEA